jgi:hypothetical protein
MVFQATGAFLEDDHVVALILDIAQTLILGIRNQVVRNQLGVFRAMGNGAKFFKVSEYRGRFQTGQSFSDHK